MSIGSVKTIPRPGSKVVEDAIGLLTAFGQKGNQNKALLEEMKAVQVHNEGIYKEVHAAIQENSALVAEAIAIRKDNEKTLKEERLILDKKSFDLTRDSQELSLAISEHEENVAQFSIEAANRDSAATQREKRLATAESATEAKRLAAAKKVNEAADVLSEYQDCLLELKNVKSKLKQVLANID